MTPSRIELWVHRYAEVKANLIKAVWQWWQESEFLPSFSYLLTTESHVYAFSIAANTLLSFFPFVLILLGVFERWFHWRGAADALVQILNANLPLGANVVVKGLEALLAGRRRIQIFTVIVMLYGSSGVFLPLEVALNKVWGIMHNRSLWKNLAISFVLAFLSGLIALLSITLAGGILAVLRFLLGWLPWPIVVDVCSRIALEVITVPFMVIIYFVIYTLLPNGKVRARQVIPAAVVAGIATEILKFVYFLTLPLFSFPETYGPFALPVTLLFWAYAGSMVLLWGAHFSAQGHRQRSELQSRLEGDHAGGTVPA
jgi:membrane protein